MVSVLYGVCTVKHTPIGVRGKDAKKDECIKNTFFMSGTYAESAGHHGCDTSESGMHTVFGGCGKWGCRRHRLPDTDLIYGLFSTWVSTLIFLCHYYSPDHPLIGSSKNYAANIKQLFEIFK